MQAMNDPQSLYRDVVLAHNRAPRRWGRLDAATHHAEGVNRSCGDALHASLRVHDGLIDDLRWDGEASAIVVATASMLGDLVVGAAPERVATLRDAMQAMLSGADPAPALGPLAALAGLRDYKARHKSALLPFATLLAALRGEAVTTTE
jgi:nitrogen fixation NifU-like protein